MENKLFTKGMVEEIEEAGIKTKVFVASDDVEDRQGEVIVQEGWDLANFKSNPVIQWAHNSEEPAIATAEKIGFKMINGKKKLVYQPKFHRKTPMSNYIADLVDAGIIKASSVGFRPIEVDENKYTKAELLEISFVNVPANQNALSLGLTKGYSEKTIKAVMPDIEIKEKAVIPYKKYPHAPEDMMWDAGAEVKEASVEDLKKMCAWYDSENPEAKSSYKMPHHTVDGYKTVLRGCQAAMGAMMGARGGVNIPEADQQAVYNHLAKHYAEFDKEPPMMRSADEIVDRYVEGMDAKDAVIELRKTVNNFIEEMKQETEARKELAETNTESFQKEITKRFEDIEFNIQGLTEGIKPSDKGLEQRLLDIEVSVEQIAKDIRESIKTSQPTEKSLGKGVEGREPVKAVESKDIARHTAIKALNKVVEVLNKSK